MKSRIQEIIGFEPPEMLVGILTAFIERAGNFDDGVHDLLNYANSSWLCHRKKHHFDNHPIEYFPFIATGGDGITLGYLVLAPELNLRDYPVIDYEPGTGGVSFIGNSTKGFFENMISETPLEELDEKFFSSIGLRPLPERLYDEFFGVNSDPVNVTSLPIKSPEGYSFRMTYDGVGVMAPTEQFSDNEIKFNYKTPTSDYLQEAKNNLDKGHFASALVHLKNAWNFNYYEDTPETLLELCKLKSAVYSHLQRPEYAKEFDNWVELFESQKSTQQLPALESTNKPEKSWWEFWK